MVEDSLIYEDTLLIESYMKQEEEGLEPQDFCLREENVEPGEVDLSDDKEIRDALAAVNKDLTRKKHEIFALSHRIEELKKNNSKRNHAKITRMRKEKYDLIDEEIALTKKKQELRVALYEWTKSSGNKTSVEERPKHRAVVATSQHRHHGSSPSHQRGSLRRDHRSPIHRSRHQSHSPDYCRRGI